MTEIPKSKLDIRINLEDLKLDIYQFWNKIYSELKPTPQCDICHQSIDDIAEWISFQCECPIYYHKQCLQKSSNNLNCTKCNDCKKIYTNYNFINKFLSEEEYQEIYRTSIMDSKMNHHKLDLYKLWFRHHPSKLLLNLYEYLEPHNPINAIKFLESKTHNHRIECYDPAYIVEEDGMTYDTNKIEYFNKKAMVNIDEFRKRLQEFSYNLIELDFPFSDSLVLTGGAVHKCLESRIDLSLLPKYCNLDIYICNEDIKVISKEFKKLVKYLQERHEKIYWVRKNINELRVYIPGYNRYISISMYRSKIENIITRFDFSHVQFLYNGQTIRGTVEAIEYANHLVSVHNGYYDIYQFPKRFYKAKQLKLCMALPSADTVNINLPREIKIETWFPTYTDELEIIKQQMRSLYNVKEKYVTMTKPCRIFYSRLPYDFIYERNNYDQTPSEDDIFNFIENLS